MYSVQCESKSTPLPQTKAFCDIFALGEPVKVKITLVVALPYSYINISV